MVHYNGKHALSKRPVVRHFISRLSAHVFIGLKQRKTVVLSLDKLRIYSYSTTNKMHLLSQIIYSCKTLYMFRMVFPSIIRSSKLRIQQRYMSNSCCYLLLSGMRWIVAGNSSCLTYTVAVYAVLSSR